MKNSLVSSLIAGLILGILLFIIVALIHPILEWPHYYSMESIPSTTHIAISEIGMGIIWGIVFGIIYSKFYESIPGIGISKGINFGIIIWFIARGRDFLFWTGYGFAFGAFVLSFFTIIAFIIYGVVLGYLYKPPK